MTALGAGSGGLGVGTWYDTTALRYSRGSPPSGTHRFGTPRCALCCCSHPRLAARPDDFGMGTQRQSLRSLVHLPMNITEVAKVASARVVALVGLSSQELGDFWCPPS